MIQKLSTIYFQQPEQYNITEPDQEPLQHSTHLFNSKFIKELNFQQNCQKKIERRIKQINNMKQIKDAIYDKFLNKRQQQHLDTAQLTGSGKSQLANQKQYEYKGHLIKGKLRRRMLNGDTTIIYGNGKQFQQFLSQQRGLYQNGKMKAGKFDFKNGYQYWGQLNGKQFSGKGTLKCPDGKRITAIWRGSQYIIGRAQISYPQGDVYYGQVQNFMKHGKGYLFFKTGNKYIGNFKKGEINGHGAYFQADGQVLKGVWKNGELIKQDDQDSQQQQEVLISLGPLQNAIHSDLDFFKSNFVLSSENIDLKLKQSLQD